MAGNERVSRRVSAIVTASVALMIVLVAFPGSSGADVTAVRGSAYGYHASVALFGGPANVRGPEPAVDLPAAGSAAPVAASAATGSVQIGAATLFSSGPITVSTEGTTGAGGSATSSASLENINTSGSEVLTAASASSRCTATEAGVSGSTTVTGGTLLLGGGNTVTVPANPAPNTRFTGTVDNVNDNFEYIFNEQITNADGSLTVYAGHMRLLGPTAVGDLHWGKSECGVTASQTTTTTGATTTTTGGSTTSTTTGGTTTTTGATTTTMPTTTTTGGTTTTTGATTTTVPTTTTTGATTTTTAGTTTTTAPATGPGDCGGRAATMVGTPGDDTLVGTSGDDVIVTLGGNDRVHGKGGDDVVCGGPGDDFLHGGQGGDRLLGEAGADHLVGAAGADDYDGGAGTDTCSGGSADTFSDCENGQAAMSRASAGGRSPTGAATIVIGGLLLLAALGGSPALPRRSRLG